MVFNNPTMRGPRDAAIIIDTTMDAVASAIDGLIPLKEKDSAAAAKTAILLNVSAMT